MKPVGILTAYVAARGVTRRGLAAYAVTWLAVAFAARFSMSALGLQFAPPGSAALDTVAVVLMLLPAGLLAGFLASQAPSLEATRSRRRHPAQLLWVGMIAVVAVLTPWLALPLLPGAVDPGAFFATWCLTVGVWFVLAFFVPAVVAGAGTFGVLALFSTPGLVPWEQNIVYNLNEKPVAAGVAAAAFLGGVALQAVKRQRLRLL
ncbi:hypothetical protein [Rhizomonospora bruguierae]|uniref:hypothetical protein n=1 Tax=Rhizomonospora bruguierae TaxID=1581705 RepID=UPI001BCB5846|nr:hypothetical protein [Micromonospora sp. NBRC 107566]